jgi:hypothetical protein
MGGGAVMQGGADHAIKIRKPSLSTQFPLLKVVLTLQGCPIKACVRLPGKIKL